MTYAEAVDVVRLPMYGKKKRDEALSVLRRAGKVMGAVEGSNCDDMNDTITILSDFPLQAHSRDIIRRAYAYKETK
jgi:hypothetical protein